MTLETFFTLKLLIIGLLCITSRMPTKLIQVQILSKWMKMVLTFGAILSLTMMILSFNAKPINLELIALSELGISFRLDRLSAIMLFMVTTIGLVVIRFSSTYLQGEVKHASFMRRMLATIACVQVLVLSGNLFILVLSWIGTSVGLHHLLLFYKERSEAQKAARKKFFIARLSDLSLIVATVLVYLTFNSGDLATIFQQLEQGVINEQLVKLEFAGFFLVSAAAFKSVQIPFHGWLLDLMETPTPVSGLLHAGLLNAGPFLIIRFASVMDAIAIAPIVLLILGGITAIYGSLVYTSQSTVKTALAYSSIAHMGFSLMVCGFGLYAASLLHFTAHSFYKAHAFLSSGSLVDKYRNRLALPPSAAHFNIFKVVFGILTVFLMFGTIAEITGDLYTLSFQLTVLTSIILIGISTFLIRALFYKNPYTFYLKSTIIAMIIIGSFLGFEHLMSAYLGNQIPPVKDVSTTLIVLSIILIISFSATIFYALFSPFLPDSDKSMKWQIYRRNGFYLHLIFDRFLKQFYTDKNIHTTH